MQFTRSHRHTLGRLALVAALALACVPTLSRWIAAAQGPVAWAQVCTPEGLKAPGEAEGAAGGATAHLDACGHCTLAAGMAAPPGGHVSCAVQSSEPPQTCSPNPSPALPAWTAAQPRGPPARA